MKKIITLLCLIVAINAKTQTVEFNHLSVADYSAQSLHVTLPINKTISVGTGYNNDKNVPIFVRVSDNLSKSNKSYKIASNLGYITKTGVFVNLQLGVEKALFAFLGVQAQELNRKIYYGLALNVGIKL